MAMMSKPRTNGPEKRKTLFDDWTSWSNAKGFLGNCGKIGGMYPNWTPFSIKEIQQCFGLYILNGLNISPRIEYKFRSQDEDPVNGNNFCSYVFRSDSNRRFKQFRALFAIQDPMLPIPSRKHAPNHKVDPFLLHMLKSVFAYWAPGPSIAGDEQDAGFQGRHPDKHRVTFKKETGAK